MDPVVPTFPAVTHYHIRWFPSGELDWKPHATRAEAEESANYLSGRHEEYGIEQFDKDCVSCWAFRSATEAGSLT